MKKKNILKVSDIKKLSTEELMNCGISAYKNAKELVDEALLLVGDLSYARSFALSFTAFEELGKAYFMCVLGCKIHSGVSKEKLDEDYDLAHNLFFYHKQKINLGNLISMFANYYEKLTIQDEILNKTFDELEMKDIPKLVNKIKDLNHPIIEMIQQSDEKDESKEVATIVDRNRSLYVDMIPEKNGIRISTPDMPRDITLLNLAIITNAIDFMESYFKIMEKFLEKDEKAVQLLKAILSKEKEEIN